VNNISTAKCRENESRWRNRVYACRRSRKSQNFIAGRREEIGRVRVTRPIIYIGGRSRGSSRGRRGPRAVKRLRSACHRSSSVHGGIRRLSFLLTQQNVAKRSCRGSKRIFRRGRPLLESLSAAKAPRVLCGQSGVTERILTRGHRLTTTASCNCSSGTNETTEYTIATASTFANDKDLLSLNFTM